MLEINAVSKLFGGLKAINNLSVSVGDGEFLGVIGPNGAGKTTLMNLITGYLKPTAGDIRFQGQSLKRLHPYQISRIGIGRTFQMVRPFLDMTVEDNVMTGAMFSGPAVRSPSKARDLARLPLELTGLLEDRKSLASKLTLAGRKKLELARALATEPRLLLLDEVMGGITRGEVEDLMGVLQKIHASGVTIVMIEHLVDVVMSLSERVVVLNFGEKLCEGLPSEVSHHPAVIESYLGRPLSAAA